MLNCRRKLEGNFPFIKHLLGILIQLQYYTVISPTCGIISKMSRQPATFSGLSQNTLGISSRKFLSTMLKLRMSRHVIMTTRCFYILFPVSFTFFRISSFYWIKLMVLPKRRNHQLQWRGVKLENWVLNYLFMSSHIHD